MKLRKGKYLRRKLLVVSSKLLVRERSERRERSECAGVVQLVECRPSKAKVAGSNPVSRSRVLQGRRLNLLSCKSLECKDLFEEPAKGGSIRGKDSPLV